MMFGFLKRRSSTTALAQQAADRARARLAQRTLAETDWEAVRRPHRPEQNQLTPYAVTWLATLPEQVRLNHLTHRFPRIVNMLALCWEDARMMENHFDSLLNDKRGGRRGFPTSVAIELGRLHKYYKSSNVWAGPRGT